MAVVSRRSAARLHGFWRYRATDAIEATGPWVHDHRVTLGRFHRSTAVPARHRTVVDGFPVTTSARTAFDLIGDPDPPLRRSRVGKEIHGRNMAMMLNDAVRRGLSITEFAAVLTTLGGRGRAGSPLARDLLKRLGPHCALTDSDGESLALDLIQQHELPVPEQQVPMSDAQGWIGTVDFLWRFTMLILEVDSMWHDGPLDRRADYDRDERLRALGFEVWRRRYPELALHGDRFVRELSTRLAVAA